MEEMEQLLDSLMQRQNGPEVSYINGKDADTLELKPMGAKGQGVFPKRSLSVKAPICSLSLPAVVAIDSDFLSTTCYHCLVVTAVQLPLPNYGCASVDLKTCNGCQVARFCNKDCQVKSWHAFHKYECKIFKRLQQNVPPAMLRAVLRLVLLQDRGLVKEEEWNQISQLVSHEQILAPRGRSNLTEMAEGIQHLAASKMSVETIQKLIFIMRANATELLSPIHGGIGVMLSPLLAKFNHSCEPNLAVHRPQHTMTTGWMSSTTLSEEEKSTFFQIVPLRDIQEGEELFNCYVVPTVSVKARKETFNQSYFFDCDCPKCSSDTEALDRLATEHPELFTGFQKWHEGIHRDLSQIKSNPQKFKKAAAAMDRSEEFLDYPVLYTTGEYPEITMMFVLEGLKAQSFDEALINVLRLYFLVNPSRFVGRHNPTNTYTTFLLLATIDALLRSKVKPGTAKDAVEKSMQSLSTKGLTSKGLIYWQRRICADLRKRLEASSTKDLVILLKEQEIQAQDSTIHEQTMSDEEAKKSAEEQMRTTLKLSKPRWDMVLQAAGF